MNFFFYNFCGHPVLSCETYVLNSNLASNELYFLKVVGLSALACGMIAVGSCNDVVTSAIIQVLHEKSEADLKDTFARFLPLALGLCYLGKEKYHIFFYVLFAVFVITFIVFKGTKNSFRLVRK